jgi:hypothetical protein
MKNQLKTCILILTISCFSWSQIQAKDKNKQILGEWIYEVSDAPYGYEKGSLIFSEVKGKTVCVIKVEAGELAVNDLKIVKDKLTFSTIVEGDLIHIELVCDKNKMTGVADTPEGPKTLTAVKK